MTRYTNDYPGVLTGALAARPAAAAVMPGTTYYDTDTGVIWTCILAAGTPTWWTPACAEAVITTSNTYTAAGSGTFESWVQSGVAFTAASLIGFTHSAGVLTYTGPGELVKAECNVTAQSVGFHDLVFGPSLNDANPEPTILHDTQSTYYRGCSMAGYVLVATGDTLRMKVSSTVSAGVILGAGTSLIIGR